MRFTTSLLRGDLAHARRAIHFLGFQSFELFDCVEIRAIIDGSVLASTLMPTPSRSKAGCVRRNCMTN